MTLARIENSYFCAGVEMRDGKVIRAPGMLSFMMGWTRDQIATYCKAKAWRIDFED